MASNLPRWVVDNVESVRREAAPYRGVSPEKKLDLIARACRAAAVLLEASPNRLRAMSYVDPLPPTSVAALERLMREHEEHRRAEGHGRR